MAGRHKRECGGGTEVKEEEEEEEEEEVEVDRVPSGQKGMG